jgi:hypothetical protein
MPRQQAAPATQQAPAAAANALEPTKAIAAAKIFTDLVFITFPFLK